MENTNKTPQQLAEEKKEAENTKKAEAKNETKTEEKPPVTEPNTKD